MQELLRHLISLAGARDGQPIRAVVGVPAEALRVSRQNLRSAVKGVADALMIVSEPFAVSYGMDALLHTMIVDIGAGTTDFCVMRGRYPTEEDQRTLTNAGDSVDEQLMTLVRAKHPDAQFSDLHGPRVEGEVELRRRARRPRRRHRPESRQGHPIDITSEMRRACESLVAPVTETMADLLARVEPEYQERVRHNIILAGGAPRSPGLAAAIERVLGDYGGGAVRVVEDPVFAGSNGSLAIALDASEGDWESLAG